MTHSVNTGTLRLVELEISRALRNKKYLFFTVVYPAALFLMLGGTLDGTTKVMGTELAMPAFYMVAMASFGALTAVLMGNSERIAREREKGWVRQLRLTALPGHGYVLAKTASAGVLSLPSILVVFAVAAAAKGVRFDAWQWFALTGAIWAGSLVFAALGVAIGYLATGDNVRPITMLFYFGLSILGGLWMPTANFPAWLRDICEWLPTHAYAGLGQAIELGGAPHAEDVAILAVYFVLFTGAAAWLYRKDSLKA
ncbi:ABC transporter permease [Streptomyces sp. NPDC012794]|uniref:ABC transporter permease n=1 Tax=Streptomyces sp. NPDC012794 TaxID=3364850 RepID=UPI0036A054B9